MTFAKNLQKYTDKVRGFIDKENNPLVDLSDRLLDLRCDLKTAVPNLIEFGDVVDVGIGQFVSLRLLEILESFASLIKPQVD